MSQTPPRRNKLNGRNMSRVISFRQESTPCADSRHVGYSFHTPVQTCTSDRSRESMHKTKSDALPPFGPRAPLSHHQVRWSCETIIPHISGDIVSLLQVLQPCKVQGTQTGVVLVGPRVQSKNKEKKKQSKRIVLARFLSRDQTISHLCLINLTRSIDTSRRSSKILKR